VGDRGSIRGGGRENVFPLRLRVQTGSGVHPASYLMGSGVPLPRVIAADA
jgi:hypothetical protein